MYVRMVQRKKGQVSSLTLLVYEEDPQPRAVPDVVHFSAQGAAVSVPGFIQVTN